MNINWTIVAPIIAAFITQIFAVVLQEMLARAREKAIREDIPKSNRNPGVVQRFLYFLFPPDIRLLLMLVTLLGSYLLTREIESPDPLTRVAVLKIAALVGLLILDLITDIFISVYKVFVTSSSFKQLAVNEGELLLSTAPANNGMHPTAGSVPVKKSQPSKRRSKRGGG
jgi:H+/gluconate symporter-like permease